MEKPDFIWVIDFSHPCWSFIEKTSVKQSIKCKVCPNFQMSFLHLSQTDLEVSSDRVVVYHVSLTLCQLLGQDDLQSDVPPGRGIWWPRLVLHHVSLTFVSLWVRLTFSQMYPQVEASGGQDRYYVRSASHFVNLWVRLTFSQIYPPGRGIWWPRLVLH